MSNFSAPSSTEGNQNITAAIGTQRQKSIGAIVGFLVFCELASGFIQGYYAPLSHSLARWFDVSDATINWFFTVQTLSAAICVPVLSKLGDMFGHRLILRIAVTSVFIGVLTTALVPSFEVVLAARIVVGPLAVWLPLEIALVHNQISGDSARKSIGLLVSFLTFGSILGMLIAGQVERISPSLTITLLVPILLLLVALYAVFIKIPESSLRTKGKIDWLGFIGLATAMVLLLWGLRLISEPLYGKVWVTWLILGTALLILVVWALWELHTPDPAINVRLISSKQVGPIYLAGFMFGMVIFGIQSPVTTFLSAVPTQAGYGFGASASLVSAVLATVMILATVGAATFSYIARLIGIKTLLIIGALLAGIGCLLMVFFSTSLTSFWLCAALLGIGMGQLLGALPALLAEVAPTGHTGIAAGIYNSLRTLGGAFAGAVFAVLLSNSTPAGAAISSHQGYTNIWLFCSAAFLVAAIALSILKVPVKSK